MRINKITFILLMVIAALAPALFFCVKKYRAWHGQKAAAERKVAVTKVRAAENEAILAKVSAKQTADPSIQTTTIDLSSVINSPLTNSFVPKNVRGNNLAELQEGIQTLAGIPFSIHGSVQLSGKDLLQY